MTLNHKTSEDKEHAEYSASGSARWMNCPGSHERNKRYPNIESAAAAEGTRAHACLEFLLLNRTYLKRAIIQAAKQWPPEMVEHCVGAVEYILARHRELPGSELLAEAQVNSSPFLGEPGQFGTLDVAIVEEFGQLIVMDFKYGKGVTVDPREADGRLNSQGAYYALAKSYEYDHNFSSVEIVVIQPRAYHESGETTRSAKATMDELLSWAGIFRRGVEATKRPNAPLAAGSWCKFCPSAIDCPEIREKSFKQAQIVFDDVQGITEIPEATAPVVTMNVGRILQGCERLEEWIKKVRAYAIDRLSKGEPVEGYKLVQKRGTRKWTDAEAAADEASVFFGIGASDAFTEPALKSPAQIETVFGKVGREFVKSRVSSVSSGVTLAPESDKRAAVSFVSGLTVIDDESFDLGLD